MIDGKAWRLPSQHTACLYTKARCGAMNMLLSRCVILANNQACVETPAVSADIVTFARQHTH